MKGKEHTLKIDTRLGKEEIHVLENGAGPRRFLVWHGFDSVNRFYHWNYLQKYGQVIRVGLPGHGPVRERHRTHYQRWTAEHFAEIAIGVCKRYRSGIPITAVGHSTGAYMALNAAIREPQLVGRLVLINPLIWSPAKMLVRLLARTRLWQWIGTTALAPGIERKRRSVQSFLNGLRPIVGDARAFYGNPNTVEYAKNGHADYKRSSIVAIVSTARICATFDLRAALTTAKLNVPALIVHGEEDPISPVRQSDWLAQRLSQATLVKFPGVGHICYAEREHDFAALVTEWLDAPPLSA